MTGGGQTGAYTGSTRTGAGQPTETWNDTPA